MPFMYRPLIFFVLNHLGRIFVGRILSICSVFFGQQWLRLLIMFISGILTVSSVLIFRKNMMSQSKTTPIKLINLSQILDLQNYSTYLHRWFNMASQRQGALSLTYSQCFNRYLSIVKPIVHRYRQAVRSLDENCYGFYTEELSKENVEKLMKNYPQLKQFLILSKQQFKELSESDKNFNTVEANEFKTLLKDPITNIYRIQLKNKPQNEELQYWKGYIYVQPIELIEKVIHGKGIAKKDLGFPTANLTISNSNQNKLVSYPNGVYLVKFDIISGQASLLGKYYGVSLLGTNPHYENSQSQRFLEVYVENDFGQELFYGAEVSVTLIALMRIEGKFDTFDCFLNAMHNDIETGKIIPLQP